MLLLPLLAMSLSAEPLRLDATKKQGVWEGWGTSLCWMGKAFGMRDDVADLFFSTKTVKLAGESLPGLGMNIVRYNAGACSWNTIDGRKMVVSKTIQPFRQMEGFWLDPKNSDPTSSAWDWTVDKAQREMMAKAKRRGANRFELFSNAPMWWMCKNDNPSGAAKGTEDNLAPEQYGNFAHYMAAVAKQAKDKWGIRFTTIDPFNEPASSWWNENGKQEGCHFDAASQAKFLPIQRAALDRMGLQDLPIAASDETFVTHAIQTWQKFDTPTRALVAQVNVHGYQGDKSPRAELRKAIGDKPLWLSEHGENDGSGLSIARGLHLDFQGLKPLAWCYWQPLDNTGWGFIETDVPKGRFIKVNPKYYVVAQYMRHIRPGMTILQTSSTDTIAAYDAKKKKLVIVVANLGPETTKPLDLSGFKLGKTKVTRWLTSPKGTARYEKASVEGLALSVPADSVETFEISGVSLNP